MRHPLWRAALLHTSEGHWIRSAPEEACVPLLAAHLAGISLSQHHQPVLDQCDAHINTHCFDMLESMVAQCELLL